MRLHHTFYIPKLEECKNIKGLVSYLAEKINTGKMCIFCPIINQKQFKSKEAVQAHMISKGHCLMELESMEYG